MDRKLILLIFVSILCYGANVGKTSIYILDEAKNAECAKEMFDRKDVVVPTFNDALRTDKPPLHYFFMMSAYYAFGATPFAARFFSVVMGVLLVVVVYVVVKKSSGALSAFLSALFLAVSVQLAGQFHLAVPDPYLLFFLVTGLLCFYIGYSENRSFFNYLFYICVSFATLAKGPVAVVFAGLIVFIFLLSQRKFSIKELQRMKILQGILLFCVIVLPWYIAVGIETKGVWLEGFFLKHNVSRFTSTMEGHGGFPLASLVIVVAALFPFSFFAPQAVLFSWKKRKENPFLFYCLLAVIAVVTFFAFSRTILPSYPEPAVPFFSIILGYYFAFRHSSAKPVERSHLWSAAVYCLVSLVMPVVAGIALKQDTSLADIQFVHYYFAVFSVGAMAGLFFILRGKLIAALYSYAAGSFVFIIVFFYVIFPQIDRHNPVVQALPSIDRELPVAAYRDFNPAFVFALGRTIPDLESPKEVEQFFMRHTSGYIVTQKRYLPDLEGANLSVVYEGQDLFERRVTVVLKK